MKEHTIEEKDAYGGCAAQHKGCPAGHGSCDREDGHDGSHHCSSCQSLF